jgi:hypothetical protein
MLPPADGGAAWALPVGRIFEVEVPLVSNRPLDVTGGTCQETTLELVSRTSDCLVGALHIIDGQSDPWLIPSKQLFVAPAPVQGGSKGTGSGVQPKLGTAVAARSARVKGGRARLRLQCRGAGRCVGTLRLSGRSRSKRAGRRKRRASRRVLIGRASFSLRAGASGSVRVPLSRKGKSMLRHARHHRLRAQLSGTDVQGGSVVLVQASR